MKKPRVLHCDCGCDLWVARDNLETVIHMAYDWREAVDAALAYAGPRPDLVQGGVGID